MEKRDGILKEKENQTVKAGVEQSGEGPRRWGPAARLALGRCGRVRLCQSYDSSGIPPWQAAAPRPAWHLGLLAVCRSSLLGVTALRSSDCACLITSSVGFLLPSKRRKMGFAAGICCRRKKREEQTVP